MADNQEMDEEGSSMMEPIHAPILNEDFLRIRAEALALELSVEVAAVYVAEQKKLLQQQMLAENNLRHQQRSEMNSTNCLSTSRSNTRGQQGKVPRTPWTDSARHAEKDPSSNQQGQTQKSTFDDEKVEDYITHFERLATLCAWDKGTGSLQLTPFLQCRARAAYNWLPADCIKSWDHVKSAILQEFWLTAVDYRIRFKQASRLKKK